MDVIEAKQRAIEVIDGCSDLLLEVSHSIHSHPEENYAEHHAHDVLTAALESHGLDVQRGAYGLPTAFEASAGIAGPEIAVFCEYDALPGIGHACGHNIIAAAGLGAALGASAGPTCPAIGPRPDICKHKQPDRTSEHVNKSPQSARKPNGARKREHRADHYRCLRGRRAIQ